MATRGTKQIRFGKVQRLIDAYRYEIEQIEAAIASGEGSKDALNSLALMRGVIMDLEGLGV